MAYLSDFHCHSDISPDSRTDLVDLVQAAADKGVAELCVTEHWECGSPCMDWQLRKKPFDFTRYLERYEAAQRALGHRVKLRLGLEVGNWTQDPDHARKGLDALPLDFVICSLHTIKGFDAYFFDYSTADIEDYLTDYVTECLCLAQQADFDAFGHLALPLRYAMIHAQRRLSFDHCLDAVDDVLRAIAQRGCRQSLRHVRRFGRAGALPVRDQTVPGAGGQAGHHRQRRAQRRACGLPPAGDAAGAARGRLYTLRHLRGAPPHPAPAISAQQTYRPSQEKEAGTALCQTILGISPRGGTTL